MRALVPVALSALVVAGCAGSNSDTGVTAPVSGAARTGVLPAGGAAPPGTITADAGYEQHLTMAVGARRAFDLEPVDARLAWVHLEPSSGATSTIVRIDQAGGYPEHSAVTGTITARSAGTVTLVSQGDADCFHADPGCMMPTVGFRLIVTVRRP